MNRFLAVLFSALLGSLAPAQAQQWIEHRPPGAGYKVELPSAPTIESEDVPTEFGPMPMTIAEVIVPDEMVLQTSHAILPEKAGGADANAVLKGMSDSTVEHANCKLRRESRLEVSDAPARRIVMDCADGKVAGIGLLVFGGDRVYSALIAVPKGQEDSANVQRFLKSFALVPR